MKTILVTGKFGQVGWELVRTLSTLGKVVAVDVDDVDFTNEKAVSELVIRIKPDLVVNAAAYTAVDRAEGDKTISMAVNAIAPRILARESAKLGIPIIHYSTDYVFDGSSPTPYTEDSPTCPINAYGETKLAGDIAIQEENPRHLIFRTSWVYGSRGKNFLLTMLRLGYEKEQLSIVSDQIGAPTWSRTIAETTAQVIACLPFMPQAPWGVYNLVSSGATSWFGFAAEIFSQWETKHKQGEEPFSKPLLKPITSEEYPTPAKRPLNSRLCCDKLFHTFHLSMPTWETALALCLDEIETKATYCVNI